MTQVQDIFSLTNEAIDKRIGALSLLGEDPYTELVPYILALTEKDEEKCVEYWMKYEDMEIILPYIQQENVLDTSEIGNDFYCPHCAKVSCIHDHRSADIICFECGISRAAGPNVSREPHWETKDQYCMIKKVFYDRVVNMRTILRNMQAYPSPLPPKVKAFIERHRGNTALHIHSLRRLMKLEKVNYTLKMAPTILEIINPEYKTLKLNGDEMRLIMNKFKKVVEVFDELKREGLIVRKNFLHYNYVLSKICPGLGIPKILPFLIMPKIASTRIKHDEMWLLIEPRL